jgi:hypothetical protein
MQLGTTGPKRDEVYQAPRDLKTKVALDLSNCFDMLRKLLIKEAYSPYSPH